MFGVGGVGGVEGVKRSPAFWRRRSFGVLAFLEFGVLELEELEELGVSGVYRRFI